MRQTVPSTPIVELYDELHQTKLSREDKLKRARDLAADPAPLVAKFADSVKAMNAYLPRNEGFYESRPHYEVGDVKATSTTDFALRVRDAQGLTPTPSNHRPGVTDEHLAELGLTRVAAADLKSGYLDRELVATRTSRDVVHAGTAVRLDLLLIDKRDRVPIVAEVKRTADVNPAAPHRVPATDKDPFSALVQALACTAQLATVAQYDRLTRWGRAGSDGPPGPADLASSSPATFDIWVVLHNRPTGTHLPELGAETEQLAALLLAAPAVARYVRRIACVVTTLRDGILDAQLDWAFERPTPPDAAIELAFARYFRAFGITLPATAVLDRVDGSLCARGWLVRWRWRTTGLEFRAAHRMTNERWQTIAPDGDLTTHPVPSEMMVRRADEDVEITEAAYRAAWSAHHQLVIETGMGFFDGDWHALAGHLGPDDGLLWTTDDGRTGVSALPPRAS